MVSVPPTSDYMSVAQFFHDKSVFVTGGTGFMGKVLVEKLLWSCPGIKNIYLLMRPKRGLDVASRLAELINSPLFERLRKERPLETKKIIPIAGDVAEPELGINKLDQNRLIDNVAVVFHAAATVRFDEPLKSAVVINMLSTRKLLALCHRMHNIEAFIHISTAYCNCDREEVDEIVYSPQYDPENVIQWMEWMDDRLIDAISPLLLGQRPNSYTFSKALAESILVREKGTLPVSIVRPSIVLSTWREPMPGWVDSLAGPAGLVAAGGKGLFRTIHCNGDKVADLIPVDMVVNLTICAAWRTARERSQSITVYNCASGLQNPITWKKFLGLCSDYVHKYPLIDALWYPVNKCYSPWALNILSTFILHTVPAHTLDFFRKLTGKKPMMVCIQTKLKKGSKSLEYFTTHQWRFKDANMHQLFKTLCTEDQQTFNFDVQAIDWLAVVETYVLGIRKFIFKQDPSSIPEARKWQCKLFWMHQVAQFIAVILPVWLIMTLLFPFNFQNDLIAKNTKL
ncbi:putative fatty acyl-CoA reductase CG5065 [Anabrus simplex]|uniref:putative fatty acyl-CoA reductase CG5065 n=1 Tax=Anabrus simplex TaxID=316456 RepID=UPI0035A29963